MVEDMKNHRIHEVGRNKKGSSCSCGKGQRF